MTLLHEEGVKTMYAMIAAAIVLVVCLPLFAVVATNGHR